MTTNGDAKFPNLFLGLVVGAVGGLTAALFLRKETREIIREQGGKSLDYLNHQAGKLRETADVLLQQGKKLIDPTGTKLVEHSTEAEKQIHQEEKRENLGG